MPIDIALPIGNVESRPPARPRQAPPGALVIFGASGDLAGRKLVPALFDLQQAGLLARRFAVLGFSRSALSDEDFRESLREGVQQYARHKPVDERAWQEFSAALHYQRGQFDDPSSYRQLADRLAQIDREHGTAGNLLFYRATPPEVFPVIIRQLGAAWLNRSRDEGVVRIVIEKPFGTDLEGARQLNHQIQQVFTEKTRPPLNPLGHHPQSAARHERCIVGRPGLWVHSDSMGTGAGTQRRFLQRHLDRFLGRFLNNAAEATRHMDLEAHRPLMVVSTDMRLSDALQLLGEEGFNEIWVTNEGRVVGLVRRAEVPRSAETVAWGIKKMPGAGEIRFDRQIPLNGLEKGHAA